jgi:sec-independent protein translocase protein TatB
MLPEVGGSELLMIAAIALIVVGPKDLPILMRKVGKAMGRMRAMAAEFRASFDEMARQSELEELRKEVEAMRAERLDPVQMAEKHLAYEDQVMRPLDYKAEGDPEFDAAAAHSAAIEAHTAEAPVADPAPIEEPTLFDLPPAETRP